MVSHFCSASDYLPFSLLCVVSHSSTQILDAPELDSTMRNHMQRIQDQILVALEDHCSAQYPTAPNRSGKILLSIASVKSIAKELTQELEIKNAMEKANMDGDMFNHIDLD